MSTNPFSDSQPAAPTYVPGQFPLAPRKPGGVLAVGICAIVLGVLGFLTSCMAIVSLPFQSKLQAAINSASPNATEAEKIQAEMQKNLQGVQDRYFAGSMTFAVLHLVVAACMIAGGVLLLKEKRSGRTFLLYTLLFVIAFEVLRAIFMLFVQLECLPVVSESMEKLADEPAGGGPAAGPAFARMMKGFMIFGLVVGMIWPLGKVILYAVCARYLASRPTIAFFENKAVPQNKPA